MYNKTFPVYCICCPERKSNADLFFKSLDIDPIYTTIYLKDNLDRLELVKNNIISQDYNFDNKKGVIACALSHLNALIEFKKSNSRFCLIFEDDNMIPYTKDVKNIHSSLDTLLKLTNWNVVNLSPCWAKCIVQKKSDQSKNLKYPMNSVCANAYAITQKGATEYINVMFPLTRQNHASDLTMRKISKSFDYRPRIFKQNRAEHYTTLGNEDVTVECTSHLIFEKKYQKYILFTVLILFLLIVILKLIFLKKK